MKDEEKDYEWNYDDGNRYRSSGRRLSSVWPLPPEQNGELTRKPKLRLTKWRMELIMYRPIPM